MAPQQQQSGPAAGAGDRIPTRPGRAPILLPEQHGRRVSLLTTMTGRRPYPRRTRPRRRYRWQARALPLTSSPVSLRLPVDTAVWPPQTTTIRSAWGRATAVRRTASSTSAIRTTTSGAARPPSTVGDDNMQDHVGCPRASFRRASTLPDTLAEPPRSRGPAARLIIATKHNSQQHVQQAGRQVIGDVSWVCMGESISALSCSARAYICTTYL